MARFGVWFLGALLVFGGTLSAEPYPLRWFWLTTNFNHQETADRALGLVERASKAGLNGVIVADFKFATLEKHGYDKPGHPYFQNAQRFVEACRRNGIQIIPSVFALSRGDGILANDPNLAAGYEVRDAVFEVRDGVAQLVADPQARLANGGFEEVEGERFSGWRFQDRPGQATVADGRIVRSGRRSVRLESAGAGGDGLCRMFQRVASTPRRFYRVTAWVRTQGLEPASSLKLVAYGESPGKGRYLSYNKLRTKATQSWMLVDAVFNSLDFEEVTITVGTWGAVEGRVWVDDMNLTEIGLVNVLRREGCPFTVKSANADVAYIEGKDFEPVVDRQLGLSESWIGSDFYHEPPGIRMLNNLPDGSRLRVSFYHPMVVYDSQVDCCLTAEKVLTLFERQIRRVDSLFGWPRGYLLHYSELRTGGGCAGCKATGKTPGQLLSDHIRRSSEIVRRVNPEVHLAVLHDMLTPTANAREDYYLIEGSLASSWEGLDKRFLIYNWGYEDRREKTLANMRFFSDRGHWQITSVAAEAGSAEAFEKCCRQWLELMDSTPQVRGMCYYTHTEDYTKLALFGRLLSAHEYSGGQQSKPGD